MKRPPSRYRNIHIHPDKIAPDIEWVCYDCGYAIGWRWHEVQDAYILEGHCDVCGRLLRLTHRENWVILPEFILRNEK